MYCPHCESKTTRKLTRLTVLGYHQYRYRRCSKQYNERAGTKLSFVEYPTEVAMIVIYYYYRFKVNYDDVVELMAMRGFRICHQTAHNWVQAFGIELGLKLRNRRKGKAGAKWHADATYLKIEGCWCYF